jgi:hypothetical protein
MMPGPEVQPMHVCRPFVLAALVAVFAVPRATGQKAIPLPQLGLEVQPPKGWVQLPADPLDRGQCALLLCGTKALTTRARGPAQLPRMRVMFFAAGADAAGETVDGLPRRSPFRDFEDFVRRGLGKDAKVTSREAGRAGKLEGRRFVAEVPNAAGDRTVLGLTASIDGGEVCIACDILTEHVDKERKELERALDGIAVVDVDAGGAQRPVAPWVSDATAWAGMDAAARDTARKAFAEQAAAFDAEAPGAGFKLQKHKVWTVVSAADAGFTKKAVAAADAARAWCEKHLGSISEREPAPATLRILAGPEQLAAHGAGYPQSEYAPDRRELLFFEDPNAGTSDGYGPLFRAVVRHWIDDHAPGAVQGLPRWLDNGLWEFFRSTRMKGKAIEFTSGEVENGRIAYYRQKGEDMPALWNLIQESMQPSPQDGANEDVWGYTPECSRLVRWLCEHDGGKAFGDEAFLSTYIRGLGVAFEKIGPDPTRDVDAAAMTEAQQKTFNTRFYAWRDSLLKQCNDAVIPLALDAWQALNAKWLAFNADFRTP